MKTREQIESAYKWKLEDMCESDAQWEKEFEAAKTLAAAFPAHAGKVGESADALYAALADESRLSLALERLYAYAHMRRDEDNGNVLYQGMTDRAAQLYAEAGAAGAFLLPEILTIPRETLGAWAAETRFAPFRFALENVDRQREHTLSTAEERLLAMAEDPLSGPDTIFTMLSDVDMTFGEVTLPDGEKVELTHGSYGLLLENPDRDVRREAYEKLYGSFRAYANTIAATYTASVKGDVFRARAHNFPSSLEAGLFGGNVPTAVVNQLVEAVHEKLPALQKYLRLREKQLGLSKLHMYDLYVPIVPDCDASMPYERAKTLVQEALAPLGEEYAGLLNDAYQSGWIDVYENAGKTSGAFSNSVYGVHPYVLLNYQGRVDDAFTLAHELGHAMHSFYSDRAQAYETSQYSIMVAEVASTVNETLLTKHLLKTETNPKRRAYYLNHFLEQFRTTCYRQTMFAEFERASHAMAERGEPLTVESLNGVYRGLNEQYYAGTEVDDNIASEWMRIPHFYRAFYVYQYATGLCSAVALANDVLKNGPARYIAFLSSGGSDYPIELLKQAGVDLTKKESILSALDVFEASVDELAALLA